MRNFRELTNDFSIEIPIIQRDYVQGRDDNKAKEIRKSFLDDIFKSLENNEKFHLDFVYGSFEETKFIPIDGQQRLTTLFLFYWYFSKRENREFNAILTYKTRVSSREFCEKIFDFKIDFLKDNKVSEQILNSKEFIPFWENDPTIKSMMIIIDEIHNRSTDIDEYFDRLDNISFEVFKLEDFGTEQSEELYRKMNSRGKSLTAFENFKAIIEQIVYTDKARHKKIAKKFERKWVDNFWKKYRDKNSLIDDSFMNFVYFITEMLSFEKGNDNRDEVRSFSFLKEFYKNEDNLIFLEHSLDNFEKIESLSKKIEENFTFFEKNGKVDLLKEIVDNYSNSTITNKILLYLVIKNIDIDKENIEFLIRISRNILYRYRALRRAGAIEYTLNLNYEQVSNLLNSFGKLKDNPYESILTIKYSDANFSHEKEKAELVQSNPSLMSKIFELEDYKYINGDLRLFFHKEFTFETVEKRVEFLSDNLKIIFEQEDSLIIRALLSIDDYSLWIGSVMNGNKFFFGQKNRWEIFLTSNSKTSNSESNEQIKKYAKFFNEYKKVNSLNKIIKNKLNEYDKTDKDWIYYFLKYPIITQAKNDLSNTFGWLGEYDCIEKLEKETRITSWYINIYLLALLNELGKEITSDFIKIDDEIEFSHLKINKNKVTIKNENIVYKKIKYPLFEKDDAIEMVKKVI
jgi:hypothetical protein